MTSENKGSSGDSTKEKVELSNISPSSNPIDSPVSYVATGTGFFLGLWKPGQVLSANVPKFLVSNVALTVDDIRSITVLLVMSIAIRLWNISSPPNIVYEEFIQLKRINNYLSGRFFYDLNPPFSTEIYAAIAQVFGYTGKFPLTSESYIGHSFPFIYLRSFTALLGVCSIIITFLTLKFSGVHRISALLGALFVAVESTFVLEYRFIFTMPIFLSILSIEIYFWKSLELKQPLSLPWHINAGLLGIFVGLGMSTHLHSYFTFIWVLLASLYQLWWSFGDKHEKHFFRRLIFNIFFRGIYLVFIPSVIYNTSIAVHLQLTPASGEGDSLVSGPFQYSLLGNPTSEVVGLVGIGSFITLRHLKTNVYLHSHEVFYPHGSYQQQVTGYGFRDSNNFWLIENITETQDSLYDLPFTALKNDDYIRIRHLQTSRRLHSHKKRAPVTDTEFQFEVTGYGAEGHPGDLNDLWKVEVVEDLSEINGNQSSILAIESILRFKHVLLGCYLLSHPTKLPEYSFEQQEVTCAHSPTLENTYWYIETNYHPKHSTNEKKVSYKIPTFSEKMEEYKEVMEMARKSVEHDQPGYSYPAWKLPFLLNGTPFYRDHHRQIILFGNFIIWYSTIAGILFYILFKLYTALCLQGGWRNFQGFEGIKELDHHVGGFVFLWASHYIPLFFETRKLTTVDYLPSLYCSILVFARIWDFISFSMIRSRVVASILTFTLISSSITVFIFYSPFVYNSKMTSSQCTKLELLETWDFGCYFYLPTENKYDEYDRVHLNEIVYQHITPPNEELTPPTIAHSAHKANPTEALAKKRQYTQTELDLVLEDYKNITSFSTKDRELMLYLEEQRKMIEEINDKIKLRRGESRTNQKEEQQESTQGEENGDDPNPTINTENVSRIKAQWLRITDPPSANFTGKTYDDMAKLEEELNEQSKLSVDSDTNELNENLKDGFESDI